MRVLKFPVLFRCLLVALTGLALSPAWAQEAPAVTITPAATTVTAGTNFTFTATVTGATATSYQWSKLSGTTNAAITGATNSTLNFTNVLSTDHGSYTVTVGTAANGTLSPVQPATLDVNGVPALDLLPVSKSQYVGYDVGFEADVYSTTPVTNGWYFNNVPITNALFYDATNGFRSVHLITVTNLTSTNAGVYTFASTNASGITVWSVGLTVLDRPDPALRFGAETVVDGQIRFPVYFTSDGYETNLSFSVSYDPAVFANANFEAVVTMTSTGSGNQILLPPPPVVGLTGSSGKRSRPLPAAIPDESQVTITNAPGLIGVNIAMAPGFTLEAGESTDRLGWLTFSLVPGAANPYAGLVTFTNTPQPLAFLPVLIRTNDTNSSVITTNSTIAFSQTPPTFTLFSTGPTLNPQSGVFDHVVEVANPGAEALDDVFLMVGLLGNDSGGHPIVHQNAQGYLTNGATYVTIGTLMQGEARRVTLEYRVPNYSTNGTSLPPTLTAYGSTLTVFTPPTGSYLNLTYTNFVNNGFLIDFPTQSGFRYYVQYATNVAGFDSTNTFRTALPAIAGTGSHVQWLDNGPPKTAAPPTNGFRVYRVLETH